MYISSPVFHHLCCGGKKDRTRARDNASQAPFVVVIVVEEKRISGLEMRCLKPRPSLLLSWQSSAMAHIIVAAIHKLSKNRPAHCTLRVIKPAAAAFLKLTLFKGRPTFLKPFKIGAADVFAFLESL